MYIFVLFYLLFIHFIGWTFVRSSKTFIGNFPLQLNLPYRLHTVTETKCNKFHKSFIFYLFQINMTERNLEGRVIFWQSLSPRTHCKHTHIQLHSFSA